MTYSPLGTPGTPSGIDDQSSQTGGTASTAKSEAKDVGQQAVGGAKQVAGTAKDQAANVAGEAKYQAKDLLGQARDQASQQAKTQQQRAAQGLRTAADQLGSMAQSTDNGIAQQVVQNVSERAHSVASWIEQREPADLLQEVRSYAARRPGVFIAVAVGAGVLVGRLTKGLVAEAKSNSGSTGGYSGADTTLPAYEPVTPSYGADATDTYTGTTGGYTTPVSGPLGDADTTTTTYPEYGSQVGNDRI